jgi:DNA polymerase-3 subunit delta'
MEGVGKQRAAVLLAMGCNCEDYRPVGEALRPADSADDSLPFKYKPCGSCKACRKIKSNNHPDIIRLEPSGSSIKIEQVRSLRQTLVMKPYEAGMRVVIVSDAGTMNPAAGNALLKVLEEPPLKTLIILVTAHISDLLPTVVSRCQIIRFNPISRSSLTKALVGEYGVKDTDAAVIAAMAGGSLSRAQRMYATSWLERRQWLINELESLSARSLNQSLAFAEQLAKDKDDLPESLEVLKSWLRDLIIAKLHPGRMLDHDMASGLQQTTQRTSLTTLLSKFDTIQSTQNAIQVGTNLRLAMESMVLKLLRV